jgi:hypothetical protein
MHSGKLVFAQLTSHLPLTTFRRCVAAYDGEHKIKSISCLEQVLTSVTFYRGHRHNFSAEGILGASDGARLLIVEA